MLLTHYVDGLAFFFFYDWLGGFKCCSRCFIWHLYATHPIPFFVRDFALGARNYVKKPSTSCFNAYSDVTKEEHSQFVSLGNRINMWRNWVIEARRPEKQKWSPKWNFSATRLLHRDRFFSGVIETFCSHLKMQEASNSIFFLTWNGSFVYLWEFFFSPCLQSLL